MRILLGLVLLTGAGLALLLAFGVIRVPPRYLPWTPLVIADEPNFLTGYKLARLKADPDLCSAVLRRSEIRSTPVPDRSDGAGCGTMNAVRIAGDGTGAALDPPVVATCPLAVAWALFTRHALQPAAQQAFGQPVARIAHLGTYACRNVNHSGSGRRSEHAAANAIDIAGFGLRGGREIRIARGWGNGPDGAFLRQARDGACRFFNVVLGPDHNALHRDHFHLDMGRFRACR